MALTLSEIKSIKYQNDALRARFEGAMVKAAWSVITEDAGTTNHANRLALAKKILLDSVAMIEQYYLFYLSNATIQASLNAATDSDIYYVVLTEMFDTVANADAS